MPKLKHPFDILRNASLYLIDRAKKDGSYGIYPVPKDYSDTFYIIWQAQAAVYLNIEYDSRQAHMFANYMFYMVNPRI